MRQIGVTRQGRRNGRSARALGAAAAGVMVLGMIGGTARGAYDSNASKFTLAAIPDPQYYSVVQWKADAYYNSQMNWIVANQTSQNIGFVYGLGDEVQDGNPYTTTYSNGVPTITTTFTGNIIPTNPPAGMPVVTGATKISTVDPVNGNFEAEWQRASDAWAILDNAGIPNSPIPGNHDYYHWDQKKDPSEYIKYFGPQRFAGKSWFGGYSPADPTQAGNLKDYAGLNTYSYFEGGGYKFLNIALQYNPTAGDLAWAQSVINANKGLPTIVSTHDYQNTTGRDTAGNNIWNGLVDKAGNDQIFMVLSGHVSGVHQQTSTNVEGNQVFEVLSDYQDSKFSGLQNGGGYFRLMNFDTVADTIHVQTYSAVANGYLTTGSGATANDFTLNFNFQQRFGAPPLLAGVAYDWDPASTGGASLGGSGIWDGSSAAASTWFKSGAGDAQWAVATTNDTAVFGGGAGTVTVAAAGVTANDIEFDTAGYTLTGGTITLGGVGPTITGNSAGTTTVNAPLAGNAGLTVTAGKVVLGGVNTFTGGLTVNGGATVAFGALTGLGGSGGAVTLDGGTISYTGTAAASETARTITFSNGGGTIDVAKGSGAKIVLASNARLAGAGDFTKTGPGWLTVYVNNSGFTGNTNVNGGVIEMGNAGALGSGAVTVNGGGEIAANTTAAIANPITINTGGTIGADFFQKTSTGTFSGPVTASGNFNVRLGDFYDSTSQHVTISGNLSGSGTATIIPALGQTTTAGKLTLTGTNFNFSGGFNVPTGTLVAGVSPSALGSGAVNLSGGKLALTGQLAPTGAAGATAAVNVSGFNKDTIYAADETAEYPSGDSINNTLQDGHFSFFQNGFTPGEGFQQQGVVLTGGLSGTAVTSAVNGTPFTLASFDDNNTLSVPKGTSGTLSLATPGAFTKLSVLAMSSWGADDTPDLTITFTDGTSVTTPYKAYDWSIGTDAARTAASVFGTTGIDRYSPDVAPGLDTKPMAMYETDIDLTNLNGSDFSTKIISSLTFAAPDAATSDPRLSTSIFAVSGAQRAWLASAAQNYVNAINVTGDSGIDVSGALTAAAGPLSITGSRLSVTSADATSSPYSLSFASATVSGNSILDVASSAGGGAGTVVIGGALSGAGSLTKTGAGLLRIAGSGSIAGALSTNGGMVDVTGNVSVGGLGSGGGGGLSVSGGRLSVGGAGAGKVSSLSITGNGTLDLNTSDLIVDYPSAGPSVIDSIRQMIATAARGADLSDAHTLWNGPGLTSTAAHNLAMHQAPGLPMALGYEEASVYVARSGGSSFDNVSVDTSAVLVKYTYLGDANLDGLVNDADVDAVVAHYGDTAAAGWMDGDFNYDGVVDNRDVDLLSALYGMAPQIQITTQGEAKLAALVAVPEPATAGLLIAAATGLGFKRRRRPASVV